MGAGKPTITIVLRGLAAVSYLTAAIIMFVSYQKIDQGIYHLIVRCNQWNGLTYFAAVNLIGCLYNSMILFIPPGSQLWKTIVVLDVVVNLVVGTSLGIGWQTYSLMKNGNVNVRWSPVCDVISFFCNEVLGSLSTCSLGFLVSFGLLMCTLNVTVDPFLVGPQS